MLWYPLRDTPGVSVGTQNTESPLATCARPGPGEDHDHIGAGAETDRRLLSGEDVLVAGAFGLTGQAAGVGARAGLGQREGDNDFARRHLRQPGALQVGVRVTRQELTNQAEHEREVRDVEVSAATLFRGDAAGHVRVRATAQRFRDAQPQQSQLGAGLQLPFRERLVPVMLLVVRRQLAFRKLAHRVAKQLVLFGEGEVHRRTARVGAARTREPQRL